MTKSTYLEMKMPSYEFMIGIKVRKQLHGYGAAVTFSGMDFFYMFRFLVMKV